MKKFLIISALLLIGALSVSAQTYCYKFLYRVDENGVKSDQNEGGWNNPKDSQRYIYITFTNGKNSCYSSDKNGIAGKSTGCYTSINKCKYHSTSNGIMRYLNCIEYSDFMGFHSYWDEEPTVFFSSDYSRLNVYKIDLKDHRYYTYVYEKSTEPGNEHAPTQLY